MGALQWVPKGETAKARRSIRRSIALSNAMFSESTHRMAKLCRSSWSIRSFPVPLIPSIALLGPLDSRQRLRHVLERLFITIILLSWPRVSRAQMKEDLERLEVGS